MADDPKIRYATVAEMEGLMRPSVRNRTLYCDETGGQYVFEADCSTARDGDNVLNTGWGGNTRFVKRSGGVTPGGTIAWGSVTGKPSTFTPSTHNQAWSTITDTPATYAPSAHGSAAHTGTIGAWSQIDKSTSSIADITTRSHTALTDIGTNAHSAIDTFIGTKAQASGLASLDGSSLVVQNPANATATPTASKIPIADGSGKLDGWITPGSTLAAGLVKLANHLGGTSALPTCTGLQETGGQSLLYGAVGDGQYLKRSGATVIGDTLTAADVAEGTFATGAFGFLGNSASEVLRVRGNSTGHLLVLSNAGSDHCIFPDPDTAYGGYWHTGMYLGPSYGTTGKDCYGIYFAAGKTAADASYGLYGCIGRVTASHSSGTLGVLRGIDGTTYLSGAGTVSYVTGIQATHLQSAGVVGSLYFFSTGAYMVGGSIGNMYGMYITDATGATITNKYGLYINKQTGAATINLSAYIAGYSKLYDNASGATDPILTIHQDHASSTGPLLKGIHDGTGDLLQLYNGATLRLSLSATGDFAHAGTKCGFNGAAAVAKASHIADPSGGATVDTEARAAINSIISMLENVGLAAAA